MGKTLSNCSFCWNSCVTAGQGLQLDSTMRGFTFPIFFSASILSLLHPPTAIISIGYSSKRWRRLPFEVSDSGKAWGSAVNRQNHIKTRGDWERGPKEGLIQCEECGVFRSWRGRGLRREQISKPPEPHLESSRKNRGNGQSRRRNRK